ncbi:MAG: hypothetical protein RBT63_00910 [Bdellovibrionales bacterium]|jgi:hypothetical protein|nr:hypothetical protein [Bdellovibrionales bacterium]
MKREQARDIGLFFLLGFMEERVALAAASRAIARLKAQYPDLSRKDLDPKQIIIPIDAIIGVCREAWLAHRGQIQRRTPVAGQGGEEPSEPIGAWKVPPSLNIDVWANYQRDASDEDLMTLLFSLVLGISDDDLAEGFKTSVGTIRYRLGKGVRQLGLVSRGRVS